MEGRQELIFESSIEKGLVVLPVYNKAEVIQQVLSNLEMFLLGTKYEFTFVIVDDGSTDDFGKLNLSKANYRVLSLKKNSGKGAAIKAGLTLSENCDFVVLFDADLDIDPSCLTEMVDSVVDKRCDIAIASKLHSLSKIDYTLKRKILSFGYYVFVKILFGLKVKDTQTGAKVFSSKSLPCLLLNQQLGFVFDLESLVLAKKFNFKIEQFPVTINMTPNSTVKPADIIKMIYATIKLRLNHHEI